MDKAVNNIALNCPIFNTHRMAAEYVQRYKLLLPEATEKRLAEMKKSYQSDTYIN